MTGTATAGRVLLESDGATATVLPRAAAVAAFEARGRAVLAVADGTPARFHGEVLAPWPNRVVDARFRFGGATHRLAVSEPARGHALHGLLGDVALEVVEATASSVLLRGTVGPAAGYPWRIDLEVEHALDGLAVRTRVRATNRDQSAVPFGTGMHPWILVEEGLGGATLRSPARTVLEVRGERMLPGAAAPVPAHLDFRQPRALGDLRIDHAFTDLHDGSGPASIEVRGADGAGARLVLGDDVRWVQLCTWDLPGPLHRRAIAVEPMTCPPDAFTSGDVDVLEPGASRSWSWSLEALGGDR